MNNCANRRRPFRLFCLYMLTSILLTTIIYIGIRSHSSVASKVEVLENDIKYLMNEVKTISASVNQSDGKRRDESPEQPIVPATIMKGSGDAVENLVKNYVENLKADWVQTKQDFEAMFSQLEKRISSSQITGEVSRTDYALESLGGQIVQVEDNPYVRNNYFLMLCGLATVQNEPRNVIRSSMSPGDCYAYRGTESKITIKLMARIFVDSVTVQHIPENMSPSGNIKSAPKDFSVFGLKTLWDPKPFLFGSFTYDASLRKPVQIFIFTKVSQKSHRYVQFHFTTNNGHTNFTCIYRLSVHGKMDINGTDGVKSHSFE